MHSQRAQTPLLPDTVGLAIPTAQPAFITLPLASTPPPPPPPPPRPPRPPTPLVSFVAVAHPRAPILRRQLNRRGRSLPRDSTANGQNVFLANSWAVRWSESSSLAPQLIPIVKQMTGGPPPPPMRANRTGFGGGDARSPRSYPIRWPVARLSLNDDKGQSRAARQPNPSASTRPVDFVHARRVLSFNPVNRGSYFTSVACADPRVHSSETKNPS